MTGRVVLRTRFPVDDAALSDLHARAFAHPAVQPVEVQPWRSRLERYSVSWVGAFLGDDLVGFVHACWDGGRHAFLLDTVVDPAQRRRGLGSLLVGRLAREVEQAGCEWLHVDFEPHLAPFYRAAGFRPTRAGLIHFP
jgi:GNAT superfamily N-acetyltransferase